MPDGEAPVEAQRTEYRGILGRFRKSSSPEKPPVLHPKKASQVK